MVLFREFVKAFREIGLNPGQPVIVHASLSSVGEIRGGAEAVLGALLSTTSGVMAPTYTYCTMVIPEVGPANNGITYGSGKEQNRQAEFFQSDLPADASMGILPETIRKHPFARRSIHPILSFAGVNVEQALNTQTIEEPLNPIAALTEQNGIVVLLGVNHTRNTSIHYAERLAGRKQFIRWALTPQGIRECAGFCGCSEGFEDAAPLLREITQSAQIGNATVQAIPLRPMIHILTDEIKVHPQAFLCDQADERCETVRRSLDQAPPAPLSPDPGN